MKLSQVALSVVTALSAIAVSHADTQSFSASYGPVNTDWTTTLSVSQFNPLLGTLTGIDWSIGGTIVASGNTDTRVKAIADGEVTVNKPGGGVLGTAFPSLNQFVNPGSFGPLSGSDTASGSISAPDFAAYIGNGTVSVDAAAKGTSGYLGSGNVAFNIETLAKAEFSITYTYTPTPPPTHTPDSGSTLAMLGAGVVLAGAIRRKLA